MDYHFIPRHKSGFAVGKSHIQTETVVHLGVGDMVKTAAGLTKTMAPRNDFTTTSYEMDIPASDVHDYYRNFAATIRGEATQAVTYPEMRRVLRVIEAAFESAEKNQVITCNI